MTHICMISNQYPPFFRGGDAVACKRLAVGLSKKGYKVSIIFDPYSYYYISNCSELLPNKKYNENNITVYPLYSGLFNFFWSFSGLPFINNRLEKLLKKIKPDIIHFQNFSAFGWNALKIAKEINKPVFFTAHDFWIACPVRDTTFLKCNSNCSICLIKERKPLTYRKRKYISFIDEVICPSQYMINCLKSKYPDLSYQKIPLGLDIKEFSPISTLDKDLFKKKHNLGSSIVGVFVGVFQKRKGLFEIIQALSKLRKYDLKILLVGEDTIGIDSIIKDNNLEKQIIPLNAINNYNLSLVYNVSNFFLLPSYWENCPLSIIEALCFNLPIISTQVGGIPEMINDCGMLIPPRDITALEKAIKRIITNPELRNRMSKLSRKKFESTFTSDIWLTKQIQLINNYSTY